MRQGLRDTIKFPRVHAPLDQAEFSMRNKLLSSWANLLGEWLKAIQLDLYNWMKNTISSLMTSQITPSWLRGCWWTAGNHKYPLYERQGGYSQGPAITEAERRIIVTNISRALHTRHCLKGFILINSFNPHSNPWGGLLYPLFPPLCRWRHSASMWCRWKSNLTAGSTSVPTRGHITSSVEWRKQGESLWEGHWMYLLDKHLLEKNPSVPVFSCVSNSVLPNGL